VPIGTRIPVFVAVSILGLSFLAHTIVLAFEFWNTNWFALASLSSNLFIFFPTLGILAVVAAYTPACAFVDVFWRHIKFGRMALLGGLVVLAALSYWMAFAIALTPISTLGLHMITPDALLADEGDPLGCAAGAGDCERLPILDIVNNVRHVSRSRVGLADFVHPCRSDPFVEVPPNSERKRFCFAATPLPTSAGSSPQLSRSSECCRSQERLRQAVATYLATPEKRSLTGQLLVPLLASKVFFLLVLLTISILLVVGGLGYEKHYKPMTKRIELGTVIVTIVVLFYPFIFQSDVQTGEATFGTAYRPPVRGVAPYLTVLFCVGALQVALSIYRRRNKQLGQFGMMVGIIAVAAVVMKYDQIVAIFVSVLGSGLSWIAFIFLILGSLMVVVTLIVASVMSTTHLTSGGGEPP